MFDESVEHQSGVVVERGWLGGRQTGLEHVSEQSAVEIERVRSLVTAIIQRNVEALGKEVEERTLGS